MLIPLICAAVVFAGVLALVFLPACRDDNDALTESYRIVNDDRIDWLAVVENSIEERRAA